jgi:hypothetical protein
MRVFPLPLLLTLAMPVAFGVSLTARSAANGTSDKKDHPRLSVKASPAMAFSPARVVVTADISGGANDAQDYYCPSIEWEWGDGTTSDATADCDPYEAGKSSIKRHFTSEKIFRSAGEYHVQFRLKQKDKTIASATTLVKIRPGVGDPGGGGY